jgi:hypothetical protein
VAGLTPPRLHGDASDDRGEENHGLRLWGEELAEDCGLGAEGQMDSLFDSSSLSA